MALLLWIGGSICAYRWLSKSVSCALASRNNQADKIENLNNDKEFVLKIDARERAEREYNARMNAAAEEGLKQGLQQGMEQGLQQGMEKGLEQGLQQGLEQGAKQEKIAIAKNALSMNMPIEQIIKLTGLTKEEIESL